MKKSNAKNRITTAAFCLLFLVGLSLLSYPLVSSRWNKCRSDRLVRDYAGSVAEVPQEDYSGWFEAAERYSLAGGKNRSRRLCARLRRGKRRLSLAACLPQRRHHGVSPHSEDRP